MKNEMYTRTAYQKYIMKINPIDDIAICKCRQFGKTDDRNVNSSSPTIQKRAI